MDGSEIPELVRLERLAEEGKQQNVELIAAIGKLGSGAATVNSSGVNIHSDGLVAVIVALVGIASAAFAAFCLVIAVAAVLVVAAWRASDATEITRLRGQVNKLDAWVAVDRDKITKLEAENVRQSTEGR